MLALGALVGLAIIGFVVVLEPAFPIRVPVHLLLVAFGFSAVLGYMARRPWIAAVAISLPLLFYDAVQILDWPLEYSGYVRFHLLPVTGPIVVTAFLGTAVAYVARRVVHA